MKIDNAVCGSGIPNVTDRSLASCYYRRRRVAG